ncbi:MAG: hypothetical protein M0C28_03155 [Candidatus Moduliflexus flocculans]|nr:hypothetical protein [Candidatus Moduliflexus flocculans]
METALARNPEVLAARARGRGRPRPDPPARGPAPSRQLTAAVEGIPLPGLEEGRRRDSRSASASSRSSSTRASASLRAAIGRQGEDLAEAGLDRVRLLLAARVKRAYWTAVFAARAPSRPSSVSGSRLDSLLEDLESEYRTGAAAYADVLRARAEKARLREPDPRAGPGEARRPRPSSSATAGPTQPASPSC